MNGIVLICNRISTARRLELRLERAPTHDAIGMTENLTLDEAYSPHQLRARRYMEGKERQLHWPVQRQWDQELGAMQEKYYLRCQGPEQSERIDT